MELTDTHTHTWYSGHGEGTPAEVVEQAANLGLTTIAITEHLTLPASVDPDGNYSMLPAQVPLYRQEVETARYAHPEVEVLLGTEVDWREGAEAFILKHLGLADSADSVKSVTVASVKPNKSTYQLILGSVHALTGEDDDPSNFWPLDTQSEIDGWLQRGQRYVWENYVRLWINAVSSEIPFDIMTHPDLPKKLGFKPDFDASFLWQQMAEAAASRGVMIELNTAGLYAPCAEVYPGPNLLTAFCRAGVPCTVSSDAHTPGNVNRSHSFALKAMHEAGYRVVTVPTCDGDRREITIE